MVYKTCHLKRNTVAAKWICYYPPVGDLKWAKKLDEDWIEGKNKILETFEKKIRRYLRAFLAWPAPLPKLTGVIESFHSH